jgi:hypothetical protein
MALGLVLVVGGVLAVPPDTILKGTTRLVFFHGAVVWTAIILGLASTILGVVILLGGTGTRSGGPTAPGGAGGVGRSTSGDAAHGAIAGGRPRTLWRLYSLATLFWVLTLVLSFPVMKASWGGIRWDETRLRMTFEVVSLYLVVWGIVFVALLDRSARLLAGVLSATGVVMFLLVALTPGNFHPDNPVFRSGNPLYIGGFLVIFAGLLCLSLGAAFLRRQDAPVRLLGEPGVDAGV